MMHAVWDDFDKKNAMNGFLIVDKPGGMTSRDVVNHFQKVLPRKTKIGHTGTLDPLATGVLVLCIGYATKLADVVQAMKKTYLTTIRFGVTSNTDDADGLVTVNEKAEAVSESKILLELPKLTGMIQQMPPQFSALKIHGQRAHDLARAGKEVALESRVVQVHKIECLQYEWPFLRLEIDCSKGTYIRSIARDLGESFKTGGIVQELRRTAIGDFRVENGIGLINDRRIIEEKLIATEIVKR
jgi:tRNA pseudouridine55 synthase